MPYATQDDLVPLRITEEDLIQLTDDNTSPDHTPAIVTVVVDGALVEASGRVDSYCRQRYNTPLQQSETVKGLTLDIAVFLLFSRRRKTNVSETVRQRYEDAISLLKDIAANKASLDQAAGATAGQSGSGEVLVTQISQRFSPCNIEGFE